MCCIMKKLTNIRIRHHSQLFTLNISLLLYFASFMGFYLENFFTSVFCFIYGFLPWIFLYFCTLLHLWVFTLNISVLCFIYGFLPWIFLYFCTLLHLWVFTLNISVLCFFYRFIPWIFCLRSVVYRRYLSCDLGRTEPRLSPSSFSSLFWLGLKAL